MLNANGRKACRAFRSGMKGTYAKQCSSNSGSSSSSSSSSSGGSSGLSFLEIKEGRGDGEAAPKISNKDDGLCSAVGSYLDGPLRLINVIDGEVRREGKRRDAKRKLLARTVCQLVCVGVANGTP